MGQTPHRQIPHHTPPHAVVPTLLCALILLSFPAWSLLQAQTTADPTSPPAPIPTLHVYTNLKQVPVLVLTSNYIRMQSVDPAGFRLSLDSGPLFRPTYVHQEGADPISLAILIDTSDPDSDLLPHISQAIASLAPDHLTPRDHVSIYALDCTLIRTAYDAPANSAQLAQATDKAMLPWQTRREAKNREQKQALAPCKPAMPLWDSMSNVLDDLSQQPGRRVLLAITDGEDRGSRKHWTQVMHYAQVDSIAVFGMLPMPVIGTERRKETGEFIKVESPFLKSSEDKFSQICSLSGGVEIQAMDSIVSWRLREFVRTVRERYIIEFPRAASEEAGVHTLAVSYKKRNLYISFSGISVPVASEDEKSGVNTILPPPTAAPAEGTRTVLLPNK